MTSGRSHLLSISDLSDEEVDLLLAHADRLANGETEQFARGMTVGLVFLETSLRTRVGFTVAAHRLGMQTVDVYEPRWSEDSIPESVGDTVRIMSGYCDCVVGRLGAGSVLSEVAGECVSPFINGGGSDAGAEHPTQALIDLFALRRLSPQAGSKVIVWGDPRMRAARSLLQLLKRFPAYEVSVVSDAEFLADSEELGVPVQSPDDVDIRDVDAVYVTGMHHESISLERRTRLIVNSALLKTLPEESIVLSPMPVIDEISPEARRDPRVRMLAQSDLALFVRMAVLAGALR